MKTKDDFPTLNERPPQGIKKDGTPCRVLIVDDSIFISKQISQILSSEGFIVVAVAADGMQGYELYKQHHPGVDLVTMDITMPKMDGISSLAKIIEFDKNACVVMISALGKQDLVKQALVAGAKSYIVKPLDRRKVLERITAVMNR